MNDVTRVDSEKSEENLQHIIKVNLLIRADIQRGIEHYDKLFKEYVESFIFFNPIHMKLIDFMYSRFIGNYNANIHR